jgi:hypothetical protein
MNLYDYSDPVEVQATFKLNGTLTNPTTTVAKFRKPSGTVVTVTASNPSTGVYVAATTVAEAGVWSWEIAGTGTVNAVVNGAFVVRKRVV